MATPLTPPAETEDVRRAVAIDYKNIQQEYCSVPTDLSRWIERRVRATKLHRLAELDLETLEESLKLDTRAANQKAVMEGIRDEKTGKPMVKAATVDEIESLVTTNPSLILAKRKVIDAAEAKEYAAGMVRAIESKESMLVSLGADIRAEKHGDPSIREQPQSGGNNRPRKVWSGRR